VDVGGLVTSMLAAILRRMSVWPEIAVGVGSGVSTGALASVLAPWAQGRVEERRERRAERKRVIAGARELVAEGRSWDRGDILTDIRYQNIQIHLRPEVEAELRAQTIHAVSDPYGTVGNYYLRLIARRRLVLRGSGSSRTSPVIRSVIRALTAQRPERVNPVISGVP
jgi:hypothetical protein